MTPGEAWWAGKDELFELSIDQACPPELDTSIELARAAVKAGYRDGVGYRSDVLDRMRPWNAHFKVWKEAKMTEIVSVEASERATQALEKLEGKLKSFRSVLGNDLTSIKAASQRVNTEVAGMSAQYAAAQALLTSPEFDRAIANAERMATALEAISRLSDTSLNVSIFTGSGK